MRACGGRIGRKRLRGALDARRTKGVLDHTTLLLLAYRNQGLDKQLLESLREGEDNRCCFGILSSHPFAILAVLRDNGRGPHEVDLQVTKEHAAAIMRSSPVPYVKEAGLRGSLLGTGEDGSVSCADTAFWIDHEEPLAALVSVWAKGIEWSFGDLPEGMSF